MTVLCTFSYLDGIDEQGSPRLERNLRWLDYYGPGSGINWDRRWLFDNCSHRSKYWELGLSIYNQWGLLIEDSGRDKNTGVLRYSTHLPRGEGENQYPFCWRALWNFRWLIEAGAEKIVFIDSDAFILSRRMAKYINDLSTGWTTFWIPRHDFPSAEVQIICRDTFPLFLDYTKGPWQEKVGQCMEKVLPFTLVNKSFVCDRYGESREAQRPEMDAYFQGLVGIPLRAQR